MSGHMTCEILLTEYIDMQFVGRLVSYHWDSLFETFAIGRHTTTTTAKKNYSMSYLVKKKRTGVIS
jgi:hypothetical protein